MYIMFRNDIGRDCIRSVFVAGLKTFRILERPWLDNRANVSCIPSGIYTINFLERSSSGKYHNVFHIMNVKNRYGILIHSGNTVNHTKGCLIIGKRKGTICGQRAVLNSKTALQELIHITEKKSFKLLIIGGQKC